jgi:uncharacterized membrane protein HdeD (DUF308 family)
MSKPDLGVKRTTIWLVGSALVVFICGILAIVLPLTFSVGIAGLLGWLLLFAGIAHVIFGMNHADALWWHVVIGMIYGIAAMLFAVNPLLGVILLALVVGVVLVSEGVIEIVLFFILRSHRHSVWILVDGILTLVLGIGACTRWPPETLEIVQYIVGISFIASGISRLLLALAFRAVAPNEMPEELRD